MRAPNHVDARRRLLPRDYLTDPFAFGRDPEALQVVPDAGDARSARIARLQHRLACRWQQLDAKPSASALARDFGLSPQVVTRSLRGERWMGETVLCALFESLTVPASAGEANRPGPP